MFLFQSHLIFHSRDALSKREKAGNRIHLGNKVEHLGGDGLLLEKPSGRIVSKQRRPKSYVGNFPWKLLFGPFLLFDKYLSCDDGGYGSTKGMPTDDEGPFLQTLIGKQLLEGKLLSPGEEPSVELAPSET